MGNEFTFSHWIAIGVGAVSVFLFVLIAYAHGSGLRTSTDFLFAGRTLTKERLANNLSATATSLAGLLLFFFLQTPIYGWITLLVIILVITGQWLFLAVLKDTDPSPEQTGSIYRFIRHSTGSPSLAFCANIVVVLNFLLILFIELIIGATIFAYLIPGLTNAKLLGMIIVSSFVLIYVILGGFRTVAYSDSWQWWLLTIGIITTFLLVAVAFGYSGGSTSQITAVFHTPTSSIAIWGTFLINAIIVNLALPTSQISSWQRFAAAKNKEEFIGGIWRALLRREWWVWLLAILLAAIVYGWKGPIGSIEDVFDTVIKVGIIGSVIVFPLLFVGLLSALVSTADSMLISLMLGTEDFIEHVLVKKQSTSDSISRNPRFTMPSSIRLRFLIIGSIAVGVTIILFIVIEAGKGTLGQTIIQLMFAGYGQGILIFPILWYALRVWKGGMNVKYSIVIYSLVIGWIVLWVTSFIAIRNENLILSHLAAIFGIAIVWAGVHASTKRA